MRCVYDQCYSMAGALVWRRAVMNSAIKSGLMLPREAEASSPLSSARSEMRIPLDELEEAAGRDPVELRPAKWQGSVLIVLRACELESRWLGTKDPRDDEDGAGDQSRPMETRVGDAALSGEGPPPVSRHSWKFGMCWMVLRPGI